MSTATALLVVLAFLSGCVTWLVGFRVGHGQSSLTALLNWGALTFVLQFAAACLAVIHARASRALEQAPDEAQQDAARRPGSVVQDRPAD